MDGEYDVIVLGTGLKECVLSGLMSCAGKKVLHLDRNSYYGGESASLNLDQLYEKFRPGQKAPTDKGRSRDYCVDLCPKFLMACGNLVKVLRSTNVTRYLEFKSVIGSYVYKDGKVHKVPATASEALNSSLMSFFQKRKFRNFLQYVANYESDDAKTQLGMEWTRTTVKTLYDYYGLDGDTQQFTGHAIALHLDDSYVNQPAKTTMENMKLYMYSVSRYGNSPYIYPLYGLGGLPEGFSRLCAIHGGIYMLNKPVAEIVFDDAGKVVGVKDTEGVVAKAPMVICDPSYVSGSQFIRQVGKIVRCIALMSHPIPDTNNAESAQIIIPAHAIKGRKSDIYVSCVSYAHRVVAQNMWVAVISANLEGSDEKQEIEPALKILGKVDELFTWVSDYFVPTQSGVDNQLFVTSSYDATSHFETATDEVIAMYERIMGKPIDLNVSAEPEQQDE